LGQLFFITLCNRPIQTFWIHFFPLFFSAK
jgi:hypothetical protein